MKLAPFFALVWVSTAIAAILDERQACYQDNCLRAVNGTRRGPSHPVTGTRDCNAYMTTTFLVDPFITTTTTTSRSTVTKAPPCSETPYYPSFTVVRATSAPKLAKKRKVKARQGSTTAFESTYGTVPYYATSACTDEHYSSACSCLGVSSDLVTSTGATVTSTVITTIIDTTTDSCVTGAPTNTIVTSEPGTSTITMTFSSTTSVTTITMSDTSGTGTGTEITPPETSSEPSTTSFTSNITSKTSMFSSEPSTTLTTSNITSTSEPSTSAVVSNFTSAITTFDPTSSFISFNVTSLTSPSTPPFGNSTISASGSTSSKLATTSSNATTTTARPTNATSTTAFPTPTICGGPDVRLCDGVCSDLSTDVQNCGACGNECVTGNTCKNGVCVRKECDSKCNEERLCAAPHGNNTCICGTEIGGAALCYNGDGFCDQFRSCSATNQCPLGTVCIPNTCCEDVPGLCLSPKGCGEQGSVALGGKLTAPAFAGSRALAGAGKLMGFRP